MNTIVLYTEEEARQAITDIKESIANTRKLIVDFYDREGWRSLGYTSFESCARQEFELSVSQVYRELSAGIIERDLPIGEIGDNRESHLRKLHILQDNDQKERAWMLAQAMSDSPIAETFDQAAKFVWVDENCTNQLRSSMLSGDLPPVKAYAMAKFMLHKPDEWVAVAQKARDPHLLPMLYRIYNEDSETWHEIALTGHIPSVDEQINLSDAASQNLKAYLSIASNEHRASAIETAREKYALIRECTEEVINEARSVDIMEYPKLAQALEDYDASKR
ncbi:MAG: hypothetical protein ACW99G_11300 [Candidatus Thorarchaeota archaeon]|jgi:hypothetical protein